MAARRAELGIQGGAIPESWEKAIARALSKNPAERQESAMMLLEEANGGKTRRTQVQTATGTWTGPGLKLVGTSTGASSSPPARWWSAISMASVFSTAAIAGVVITAAVMFALPKTRNQIWSRMSASIADLNPGKADRGFNVIIQKMRITPLDATVAFRDGREQSEDLGYFKAETGETLWRLNRTVSAGEFESLIWPVKIVVSARGHLPKVIEVKREEHASEEKLGLKFLNLVRSDVSLVPFHEFTVTATFNGRPYALPPAAVQVADETAITLEAIELGKFRTVFPLGRPAALELRLGLPGFQPLKRSFPLSDPPPSELSFGELARAKGKVQAGAGGDLMEMAAEVRSEQERLVDSILLESTGSGDPGIDLTGEKGRQFTCRPGETIELPTGSYDATLVTICHPPFQHVSLGNIKVTSEAAVLLPLPVIPLGVFGGSGPWTTSIFDSAAGLLQDEEGVSDWFLIQLPPTMDSQPPRLVQFYADKTPSRPMIFLPAAITEASLEGSTGTWLLTADPRPYEEKTESAALRKRYYSKLTLRMSLGAKKSVSYRVVLTDQPTQRPPQERQLVLQALVEGSALSGYPLRNETDFQRYLQARGVGQWPIEYAFGLRAGIFDSSVSK
jgi:hypothetical protein